MHWLPHLEYEPESGPIRYTIFRQSPYFGCASGRGHGRGLHKTVTPVDDAG